MKTQNTPPYLKKYSVPGRRSRFAGGSFGRSAWLKHCKRIQREAAKAKENQP